MTSIRRGLMLRLGGAIVLLSAVWGVGLYEYVRVQAEEQFDEALLIRSQTIGSLLRQQDDGRYTMDYSDQSSREFGPGAEAEYFQIVWPGHGTVERSASLSQRDLVLSDRADQFIKTWDLILPDGRSGRAMGRSVVPTPERFDRDEDPKAVRPPLLTPEPMIVINARGRHEVDSELTRVAGSLWIGCSLLGLVGLTAIGPIVLRGLKPVDALADEARRMGPEALSQRFAGGDLPHELKPIAAALNELLDRLQLAFLREKRINANIAHELRTPIAELRSLTDVALRDDGQSDRARRYFTDARDVAQRMERLIESLSLLGQGDAVRVPLNWTRVPLATLIRSIVQTHEPELARRRLRVECDIDPGLTIRTDESLLRRIIDNLIDNAAAYAAADGPIRIEARRHGETIVLHVANADHTLADSDLPMMFEPFWQKDAARADDRHAGLGLSLVQSYARLLQIGLHAHLPTPGTFEVHLRIDGRGDGTIAS